MGIFGRRSKGELPSTPKLDTDQKLPLDDGAADSSDHLKPPLQDTTLSGGMIAQQEDPEPKHSSTTLEGDIQQENPPLNDAHASRDVSKHQDTSKPKDASVPQSTPTSQGISSSQQANLTSKFNSQVQSNPASQGKMAPDEGNKTPLFKTKDFIEPKDILEFKEKLFDVIIKQIDLSAATKMQRHELRREIEGYLIDYSKEMNIRISHKELQNVIDDIINDMIGLGPIEVLLKNNSINDIMVNAFNKIFVEIKGMLYITDVSFRSEKHSLQIAQRIANQIGRRIDESSPLVDARLRDGSRVNIVIPPVSLDGTSISIRKFSNYTIYLRDMPKNGNISEAMVAFLQMIARTRLNIIISGGTGAGKTTLLNAISQLIDEQERIVTIEDAAELKLQQPHVVRLESRPANIEGQGLITIRDLVKNALRMRPDRIIIGECRGGEAFDMLQAMNTGHDGSMSTLHSNSSNEALGRLENLVLMSGNQLPNKVIQSYIGDAIDIIVQIARMRDGTRRVVQITEVSGCVDGEIKTNDIFLFHHTGSDATHIQGEFVFKGLSDGLVERILDKGFKHELDRFMSVMKE